MSALSKSELRHLDAGQLGLFHVGLGAVTKEEALRFVAARPAKPEREARP